MIKDNQVINEYWVCGSCGATNNDNDGYCENCGTNRVELKVYYND